MKGFLLDSNLPARVQFATGLPVVFAFDLGASATDTELWNYAREHDLAIVSKDADFSERIVATNPPPYVVHLRIGNMRRRDFHTFLAATNKLVNVYRDRIETVK